MFRAESIKAAEAAKAIENAQRDINIAFMNEVAQIVASESTCRSGMCSPRLGPSGISCPSNPGLVGGHCIGVDPYYLSHLAEQVGLKPQVVLAGRDKNDAMADGSRNESTNGAAGRAGC